VDLDSIVFGIASVTEAGWTWDNLAMVTMSTPIRKVVKTTCQK
jgi:hypothetical protein